MAVVLQGCTAAGGVDQDRGLAGHRCHDLARQIGRRVVQSGVGVQRTTASPRVGGDGVGDVHRIEQRGRRTMRAAHPGVHHATGEQPHVASGGSDRRPAAQRQACQAEAARDEPESLRSRERRRAGEQRPMASEHREAEPLPARRDRPLLGELFTRALDQPAERDPARAGRLAPTALHAGRHDLDEVVVDRSTPPLHCPHGVDPASR